VAWGHLHEPDIKFGLNSANFNVSVICTDDFIATLDALVAKHGATKLNAYRPELDKDTKQPTGRMILKAKTTLGIDDGHFPCVDAQLNEVSQVAFGGDKVRLILRPMLLQRDNSLSLYLNKCQIVEKSDYVPEESAGGFDVVEDGFTGSAPKVAEDAPKEQDFLAL
jgi:hypothetical protein